MATDDTRLYIVREREFYESARGQAMFAVSKSELDTAEQDPHGIIREESARVICLAKDPRKYMGKVLDERAQRGEPLYPQVSREVSAPKQDQGRVEVGFESVPLIKDVQNNGIIVQLRAGDIVTRGGGLMNFLVVERDGRFYATAKEIPEEEMTVESIRKRAYRRIGSFTENPELIA